MPALEPAEPKGLIEMAKFVFIYRPPKNYAPGSDDATAAWMAWFGALGANIVDPGDQVFERTAVGGVVADSDLGGYSVITADDLASARELANGCPGLQEGFIVEVGKLAERS
jgi:hypothetical protein